MAEPDTDDGFLTRWSRRKVSVREGQAVPAVAPPASAAPVLPLPPSARMKPPTSVRQEAAMPHDGTAPVEAVPAAPQAPVPPPPTLEDVARLTPSSDFRRFVAPDVSPDVRNAALKQLFADPHFNVMDGLDTYIDDYGKPDPLPIGMLRKMAQAKLLNLFADEDKPQASAPPVATHPHPDTPADEDPAVRLQPNDAAGPPGPEPGPGESRGGQH